MSKYRIRTEKVTVTTAGTRVPLSASTKLVASLAIDAYANNTNNLYVGDETVSSTNGLPLKPEKAVSYELQNDANGKMMEIDLSEVYLDADSSGNYAIITYLERT